jgi:peptidoglycan/LPS O-acetylase OafA/YrhL
LKTPKHNFGDLAGKRDAPAEIASAAASLPPSENKKFYPALNGLRAVAVLMVFYQHYLGGRFSALSWGWAGVDFFFVLSGFLITGILYDTRHSKHRIRNFYGRRILRIFPLYYGVLLAILLAEPFMHWVFRPAVLMWPLYLGNYSRFLWLHDWQQTPEIIDQLRSGLALKEPFTLMINHFWSLCVEEQFYLFWPPIVFLVSDRVRLRNLCFLCCGLCLAARILGVIYLPQAYLNAEILYRATPFRVDALLMGGAVALMLRGPEGRHLLRWAKTAGFVFVAGFAAFQMTFYWTAHRPYDPTQGMSGLDTAGFLLIDLFAVVLVLMALETSSWVYRGLCWRWLRWLGEISYGFYIFQDLFREVYLRLAQILIARWHLPLRPLSLTTIIGLLATTAISWLSFRYFESRFLRLKSRFANQS